MRYLGFGISHDEDCTVLQKEADVTLTKGHRGQIMTFARCAAAQYALIRDTSSRIKMTGLIGSANPYQGIPTV